MLSYPCRGPERFRPRSENSAWPAPIAFFTPPTRGRAPRWLAAMRAGGERSVRGPGDDQGGGAVAIGQDPEPRVPAVAKDREHAAILAQAAFVVGDFVRGGLAPVAVGVAAECGAHLGAFELLLRVGRNQDLAEGKAG